MRLLYEALKTPRCWKCQSSALSGKQQQQQTAHREWKQLKIKKCVVVNKDEKTWISEESFDIRHKDIEFGVYPADFQSCFVLVFS